ncbi:hephaestin-like protein [Gigantopelta aegis]|uniref:hephaestin-like protein n=1 Tax=Gigantopelta aegis TaxID=1735272 RepID=UPI001B88ACC5|nr:hephaestin-like protein [Gigantopelta aegis]
MSWWLYCLCVTSLLSLDIQTCRGSKREYFLAAEHVDWDYAPSGKNLVNPQQQSEADEYLKHGWNRIGRVYKKAIYKQYTDATFSTEIPKPPWLGLIGPIIRAEVDDVIVVNFLNRADRVFSIHPHGLLYHKNKEGALYVDGTQGASKLDDMVNPGERFRYVWHVNASNAAPTASDPDCLPWVYHSHVNTPPDTNTGLIGVLITCRKGVLDDQARRRGTDREYALVVKAFDENLSWLATSNSAKCGQPRSCLHPHDVDDFRKSNIMYSINGLMYGHLRGLDACAGDNITWYIIGMGNEIDIHSIHFHGQTLHYEHHSGDTVPVFPAIFKTARMTAGLPGRWLVNCMVSEHFKGKHWQAAFINCMVSEHFTGKHMEAAFITCMVWEHFTGKHWQAAFINCIVSEHFTGKHWQAAFINCVVSEHFTGKHWQAAFINCVVSEHFTGGMSAFLNISDCGKTTKVRTGSGNSRWYYLAVEEEDWDYGPSGMNKPTGSLLNQTGRLTRAGASAAGESPTGPITGIRPHPSSGFCFTLLQYNNNRVGHPGNVRCNEDGGVKPFPNLGTGFWIQTLSFSGAVYRPPEVSDGNSEIPLTSKERSDLEIRRSELYFAKGPLRIGGKYRKVRYHQYDDLSYVTKKAAVPELGILGPVIRAEVGDDVNIVLRNRARRPFSFLGHGLLYDNTDEGTYDGVFHHGIVQAGAMHVYHTRVPDDLLRDADPDCIVQLYHSAVDEVRDINSGLIGPLLICKRGKLGSGGKQTGISKEFFLLFATFDENLSWYLDENLQKHCAGAADIDKEDDDFEESNRMHGLNGRSFQNLEGLTMCLGDNVTWHTMSYGSETGVQSPYFHGNAYSVGGTHRDTGHLVSGGTESLLMVPDNPGTWMVTSDNTNLFSRGITATYTVAPCGRDPLKHYVSGVTRQYLIAAEEVQWDYAPSGTDHITGADLRPPSTNFIFTRDDNNFIGRKYKKAIYREYTDITFTTRKPRDGENIHLGIMGPMIKAEVGDVIEIVFKNKASRHYSIHSHGLLYDKANAGYSYADDLFLEAKKGVAPNSLYMYHWHVPERAGPGPGDPNCIPWLYSSGVDTARDPITGLVGTVVVCRKGILGAHGKRTDVDREFALLFSVFNENHSWYLKDNVQTYAPGRLRTSYEHDADFKESNKMHCVNGLIAANNDGLVMNAGDTTVWYVLSVGSEIDLHTVHFHGHSFVQRSNHGHRTDVLTMFPSNAEAVTLVMDNPGTWILHCHVLDHITAGMETVYTVRGSS